MSGVKLHLSHHQILKARAGHPIQLKHEHIGRGVHFHHLHPETMRKLKHAHEHHKGVRIHLSHEELHGAGLLDFVKKAGSAISNGLQTVGKTIYNNRDKILPVLGSVADIAATVQPEFAPYRAFAKDITGVGFKTKHHQFAPNVNSRIRFMPGDLSDIGEGIRKTHHKKKHHKTHGTGIFPAGY
jgi:hypothetical protein